MLVKKDVLSLGNRRTGRRNSLSQSDLHRRALPLSEHATEHCMTSVQAVLLSE